MSHDLDVILQNAQIFEEPTSADTTEAFASGQNFTSHDLDNNLAGASEGTRTRLALGTEGGEGINLGAFSGSVRETVQATDTIDSIASRNRVPREAIIDLNNLIFPFIMRGGPPGTLSPGDAILIPVRSAGGDNAGQPLATYLTPEEILYGVDLKLDVELAEQGIFDIAVDVAHGSLDAELVGGVPNVSQGIRIIISTERDTTDFLPGFGILRAVGLKSVAESLMIASLNLREAILTDPRIAGIESTRIVLEGDVLSEEITPILANARDGVTLSIPFGSAGQG